MEVFKKILGKSYKRLRHTFEFTIKDDPEENNFEIGNINLHYRKKEENVYLVFGSYDLVYCFKEKQQDYRVKCMTKPFCTIMPVRLTTEIQKDEDIHINLNLNLKDVKVVASNFIKGSLGEFLKKNIAIIPKRVTAEVVITVMMEIESHIYEEPEIIKPEGIVDAVKEILPAGDMQEEDVVEEDEVLQQEYSQLREDVFKEDEDNEDLESNGQPPVQPEEIQTDKKEPPDKTEPDKLQQKKIKNESFQLRYAEEYRKLANYGWFEKQYMANLMPRIERKPSKVKANNKGGYG